MIKKLNLNDCAEGLWKNGLGKTRQVAIFPHEATLEKDDFLWRLSSATIQGENSFSEFPGRDRWLIVWKGEGLKLNGKELLPHSPLKFAGEEKIQCSLIENTVTDMGLIYDREKYSADLEVLTGNANINAETGTHFLFIAKGNGLVGKHLMQEGEFLIVENRSIQLELKPDSIAYHFRINRAS